MLTEMAPPEIGQPILDELAQHLKLPSATDAETMTEITSAFRASVAHLETQLGLALVQRGFSWIGRFDRKNSARAPIGPISEVLSVQRYPSAGEAVPVNLALVQLDQSELRTRIRLATTLSGPLKFTFVAGFGPDWSDVPADLRRASFMLAAHYFDTRHDVGAAAQKTPHGVDALIAGWRPVRIGTGVAE